MTDGKRTLARVLTGLLSAGLVNGCGTTPSIADDRPAAQPRTPQIELPEPGVDVQFRGALPGQEQRIDDRYLLNEDCSSTGPVVVQVTQPPSHGRLTHVDTEAPATFDRTSAYAACNAKAVPVVRVSYRSEDGYVGADQARVEYRFGNGQLRTVRYVINTLAPGVRLHDFPYPTFGYALRSTPSTADLLLGSFYTLNSDCSEAGVAVVQVLDGPAHGAVNVAPGLGTYTFAADRGFASCNGRKGPATLLRYASEPTFVGTDNVTVAILYAGGSLRKVRYEIRVFDPVSGNAAASASTAVANPSACADRYPEESRRKGEEGTTTLLLFVAPDGQAKDARIEVSSGFPRLDQSAAACVLAAGAVFKPHEVSGQPVSSWVRMKYKWTLLGPFSQMPTPEVLPHVF